MNQEEHLKRIRAKCVGLLAMAEKRTPDEWRVWGMSVIAAPRGVCDVSKSTRVCSTYRTNEDNRPRTWDADFIAACPGNAEAGWRSTIAAIDLSALMLEAIPQSIREAAKLIQADIMAAWPEEML